MQERDGEHFRGVLVDEAAQLIIERTNYIDLNEEAARRHGVDEVLKEWSIPGTVIA